MIVITGSVHIREDAQEAARPVMEKVLRLSRAERGCVHYAYGVDVLDPTLIHVSEQWESEEDLQVHLASDHIAEWRSTWESLGIGDRKLQLHTVSTSKAV